MAETWRADVARARADLATALGLLNSIGHPGGNGIPPVDPTVADDTEKQNILDARRLTTNAEEALERAWEAART